MKRLFLILLILFSAMFLNSCWQTDISTSESLISGSLFPPDSSVALNAVLSGSVSSELVQSTEVSAPLTYGSFSTRMEPQTRVSSSSNSCRTSAYETHLVGGNGTAISSGTATAGYFSATTNDQHEVILDFECGMRCIGKPGSNDLICDAVSNAILSALENALETTIATDVFFDGLSIAKIVEGIGETLKLMSILDPTNSIAENLAAAETPAEMEEILTSSALGPLFTSITTMALERKAYNYAIALGMTHEEALAFAAAASWTVENVVTMLVGLGLTVDLEVNGSMSLYGDVFNMVDTMTGTTYVADFRIYLSDLYNRIYVNNTTSSITIICHAKEDGGDHSEVDYPPYFVDGQLSCYDASTPSETDEMGVTKNNGTEAANDNWRANVYIKSSNDELNRNDPLGLYDQYNGGLNEFRIGALNVFNEIMVAMQTPVADGGCGDYIVMGDQGVESIDPRYYSCMAALNINDYFSGVLGVYNFMRNKDLREIKFSLNELYEAITGLYYMTVRINMDPWQAGIDVNSDFKINVTDGLGQTRDYRYRSYQLYETGTTSWGGPAFTLECVNGSRGTIALCNGNTPQPSPISTTAANYRTLVDTYKPSYNAMFFGYDNLPTMEEIRNYIFKGAHHGPYNIAGSKTFNVLGNMSDDNDWEADKPIMCRFNNANVAGDFVAGTSSVTCAIADGTTWDNEGNPSDISTYASYFALQGRGRASGEDQSDEYYALININNGFEYHLNGRPFRIRGIMASYSEYSDNPTINGTSIISKTQEFCDNRENDDGVREMRCWTDVFSYVAVEFPDAWFRSDDYWPYTWDVPMNYEYWDPDTEGYIQEEWNVAIAMTQNNTQDNYSDDRAVCLKYDESVVDTNDASNDYSRVLDVTVDVIDDLVDCFDNTDDYFYYLAPRWGAADRTVQYYDLIRNDGLWMWSDEDPDESKVSQLTIENVLGKYIGPAGSSDWINYYEVANLSHDAKFDPFCDDYDGNGECNCTDDDGDGECTLADTFTEPTLSDPPYWRQANDYDDIQTVLDSCGGKSGATLITCMVALYVDNGIDLLNLSLNWNEVLECENSSKTMNWVDIWGIPNNNSPEGFYGKGCGSSDNDYMGKIRMKKLIKRDNAYDIRRPNTVMRMISAATASTGTGAEIDPEDELFNFQEALAFAMMRLVMPIHGEVTYNGEVLDNIGLYFDTVRIPDKENNMASGLLRKFLEKGGVVAER
jgi:hypothetical protein